MACILCGKPITTGIGIVERINGTDYPFDKRECLLTFRKLESVYGAHFSEDFVNS